MFHRQQAQSIQPQAKPSSEAAKTQAEAQASAPAWIRDNKANTNMEGTTPMAQPQTNTATTQDSETKTADIPANQGYSPVRSGFTGARYPAYGSTTPSAQGSNDGRQLVIGAGITMSGEIAACEHLVVQGHVEAALKGARVLEVSETGSFAGQVEIEEATIAGTFDGSITVSGRLTVKASGKIRGTIAYGELAVEAGAQLDGKLGPVKAKKDGEVAEDKTSKTAAATATKTTAPAAKSKSQDKDGSELPFASSAA